MPRLSNLSIENAHIMFRNFSGKPDKFDKVGHRSFNVVLDEEDADKLSNDGWNIRVRENRRDPDADNLFLLPVAVSYENYPPKIYLVTSHNKVLLTEDTVGQLDDAAITYIDLVIRPYSWEVNGKSGVKAYVRTMYVTIEEDQFAKKYNFKDEPMDDEDLPF